MITHEEEMWESVIEPKIDKYMKQKMKELFRCNIAGVQYGDYQLCLGLKAGKHLNLIWEPSNQFDSQAIRVEYNGVKLGYIPRTGAGQLYQEQLHDLREQGVKIFTTITAFNPTNPTWYMFTIKCEIKATRTKHDSHKQFIGY